MGCMDFMTNERRIGSLKINQNPCIDEEEKNRYVQINRYPHWKNKNPQVEN